MRNSLLFSFVLIFLIFNSENLYGRKWIIDGHEVNGKLIQRNLNDPSCVIINLEDGRGISSIPIPSFSQSDQVYILQKLDEAENKPSSNTGKAVVTVSGIGRTMTEAKQDAFRNAVEKVAGTLVGSLSSLDNDELMEEIRTSSNAYIENQKMLSHKFDGSVYTVKMELTVIKSSLTSRFRRDQSSKGSEMSVDGAAMVESIEFKAKSEKEDALYFFDFLAGEKFPYRLLKPEFIGSPEIVHKDGFFEYTIHWKLGVNADRYNAFIGRLMFILDKHSIQKTGFSKTFRKSENGWLFYPQAVSSYREKNVWLFLVKEFSPESSTLKYSAYELPRKFAYPLFIYKCVVPRLHIQLLDSRNQIVTSFTCRLNELTQNGYKMECFNLCPAVGNDYYSLSVNRNSKTSQIGLLDSPCNLLFSIAPYMGTNPGSSNTKFFVRSLNYDLTFKFSKEELSRIKNAQIFISTKNPDLKIMAKKIDEALDQETTDFGILESH